ncbi:MAG TPA: GldG family protein [Polyangiaceae bacterium]
MKRSGEAISLVGIASAVVVAVLLNVLAARHYTRADWTSGKLYTLTQPTMQTLHALDEPVEVWVLLGGGDPLEQSLRHLIASYTAETSELRVHYIDPDKDALALEDIRKRFNVQASPAPDGRMVADAIVIVARGERHWFLTPRDMVEVAQGDDVKAKPREEQAITGAIRRVIAGDKTKLCFVAGHGERSIEDGSEDGLGVLKDVLDKDNYDSVTVDTTPLNAYEPFKGCDVVIVAAPRPQAARGLGALTDAEETRLRAYLLSGGNFLLAIGAEARGAAPGYGKVLESFGIGLDDLLVIEADPTLVFPNARGDTFVATAKANPITTGLVPTDEMRDVPKVVLDVARPLRHVTSPATVADLLTTSDKSFAVNEERASEIARAASLDIPEKRGSDRAGPFILAMASEGLKPTKDAPHGPRVVVVGSSYAFSTSNFRAPLPWHGTAFLMGNAIAWLSAKPAILDIPDKPSVGAGLRMTTATEGEVRRYVLAYMPITGILLGILVAMRRRSTEGKKHR